MEKGPSLSQNTQGKVFPVKTDQVLANGIHIYLRYLSAQGSRIVPLVCHMVSQPGNVISTQWGELDSQNGDPPDADSPVICNVIAAGVLYSMKGLIFTVGQGRNPRIRISLEDMAIGQNMRRHPRSVLFGRLAIGRPGEPYSYTDPRPRPLNISMGGFGAEIPVNADPGTDRIGFSLGLYDPVYQDLSTTEPSLTVAGVAAVRSKHTSSNAPFMHIGCQFIEVPGQQTKVLEAWLAAFYGKLRRS